MFPIFVSDDTALLVHWYLIGGDVLATIAVGIGILWEAKAIDVSHKMAAKLVLWGVVVETLCSITLFAFDEGVSRAQQSIIEEQQGKIIALETRLAPRVTSTAERRAISGRLRRFQGMPCEMSISSFDPEVVMLLKHILATVQMSGWVVNGWAEAGKSVSFSDPQLDKQAFGFGVLTVDVTVDVFDDAPVRTVEAAKALSDELNSIGIKAVVTRSKPPNTQHPPSDTIRVEIGPKMVALPVEAAAAIPVSPPHVTSHQKTRQNRSQRPWRLGL